MLFVILISSKSKNMRIITGEYRGRKLSIAKGTDIRYTAERVKGALFSILRDAIQDARFLDIYAGSGNIGLEAISRGAESVTFVDMNPACTQTIVSNLKRCGLTPEPPDIMLLKMRMPRAMEYFRRHNIQFDIIFLDPPYNAGLVEKTLQEISTCAILSDNGDVIAQHHVKENAPEQIGILTRTNQKIYGSTMLSFYELIEAREPS